MKILFYNDHHDLPFWHQPSQSSILFDPEKMSNYLQRSFAQSEINSKKITLKETELWPVLMGLHELNLYNTLAHVSLVFIKGLEYFDYPKRVWIQISTYPEEQNEGIPLILKDGKVNVTSLWGIDNGTYSPLNLVGSSIDKEELKTSLFWSKFFRAKILEERGIVLKKLETKQNEVTDLEKYIDTYNNCLLVAD